MALTGQLSDMSLAELIEFFCNQRKTGRLKIDYPRGHSVFFIKDGELVDAKVGALQGAEAVYFSLTLPNAAFDFSPEVMPQRRTINQSWTQVVLEGLRRLDEGQSPTEADAFGGFSPTESDMAQMLDHVERLGEQKARREKPVAPVQAPAPEAAEEPAPFSMMVESASGGGKKKWVLLAVAAALVAACVLVAVPLMRGRAEKAPAKPEVSTPAPAQTESQPVAEAPAAESSQPEEPAAEAGADAAAAAARREERERRERERRERRAEEAAARRDAEEETQPAKPAPSGPKSVRVTVTYDEAGRVTQASVAGATPGAEAYGSTAVRIARGRRFAAGKPGSTVVTIPVN
ncbi:MAG TPA: TonB family protein [Pyrinomonadaceae bacterium]|jgi:TonB family protein|nr:TonB family protein [Pyrinomonadaceae bacterium]